MGGPGEPNNAGGGEDCAHMYKYGYGEWNDAPCSKKVASICSIGEVPADVCSDKEMKIPMPPAGAENYDVTSYRCHGMKECCTAHKPCKLYDGHCDNDQQCEGRLKCGQNNCAWGNGDRCCERRSFKDLDAASHYFNIEPKRMDTKGEFKFLCSRNNDFTNRSHKGKVK